MKHPLAFLEIWAIKINPVMLKPSSNVVALPDFSDLRALKAQGLLWPRALQGVKHLNRVIPPFQSHGSGMGGISKHPSLADRSVLSYTITSVKCNKRCRQEGIVWFVVAALLERCIPAPAWDRKELCATAQARVWSRLGLLKWKSLSLR